MILIEKE